MSYEHDYYSDQCAGCKWAEWRGGCLNKATADDGSDLDAAERDECKHFEAGNPQKRQLQPSDRLSVVLPLDDFDALHTRAEAAEAEVERLRAELAQARDDVEIERDRVIALEACVATRNSALVEAHAELAQAQTDARLMAELWRTEGAPLARAQIADLSTTQARLWLCGLNEQIIAEALPESHALLLFRRIVPQGGGAA